MRVLISGGKLHCAAHVNDAVELRPDGARTPKVLALGGDKIRSRYERDIGDGIDDIGPEDGAARFEFVVESGGADACFGSGQTLGAKQRIVFGEGCPLAKAAVQLVQRGRTKCAIAGERERPVAAKIADHGNARTERGVATV